MKKSSVCAHCYSLTFYQTQTLTQTLAHIHTFRYDDEIIHLVDPDQFTFPFCSVNGETYVQSICIPHFVFIQVNFQTNESESNIEAFCNGDDNDDDVDEVENRREKIEVNAKKEDERANH